MRVLLKEVWEADRRTFIRIILGNIVRSLLGGFGIVLLIPLLNLLDIGSSTYLPAGIMQLPYETKVILVLVIYVLIVVCKELLNRHISIEQSDYSEKIGQDLRNRLYKAVSEASWETLAAERTTDTIQLFASQCTRVSYGITGIINLISDSISSCLQLGIALAMNVPVTILVCILGGCLLTVFKPLRKKSKEHGDKMIKISREFYMELHNQLSGVREVRAYGVEKSHEEIFLNQSASFREANLKYIRFTSIPGVVYSVTAALLIAGLYLFSTLFLKVPVDRLVVLVYVFARLWPLFSGLQNKLQYINSCVPSYEKLEKAWTDMQKEHEIPYSEKDVSFSGWQEARLDHVSFAYREAQDEAISDMSFSLKRGEIVALLGNNGSGKTTAVNLLLGFLMPKSGTITVDGTVLTNENIRSWRKQAGYVPQDPLILNASVRENLKRFHPEASDADIIDALKKAMAWGFVEKLSEGLDTVLGDRGVRLSGGERQRIVLARVLLGKPSLVILDEATSALDYGNAAAFRDIVKNIGSSAAVVVIAHSMTAIRMADRGIVLKNGVLTEQGTIDELTHKENGYLSGMLSM